MDRRSLLKGFGSMVSWSRGIQSRLFRPPFGDDPGFTAENASAGAGLPASGKPAMGVGGGARDIRRLTQHFTGETEDISPWVFVPQENIRSLSTSEHPGFVTVWHGDKGKDIKGILKDPIRIDDYPLPWEFHLGLARGTQSAPTNWALGLNLVLTFSDPSTWPKDRTKLPPQTHSFQLLDVHLKGPQIESGPLNYCIVSVKDIYKDRKYAMLGLCRDDRLVLHWYCCPRKSICWSDCASPMRPRGEPCSALRFCGFTTRMKASPPS